MKIYNPDLEDLARLEKAQKENKNMADAQKSFDAMTAISYKIFANFCQKEEEVRMWKNATFFSSLLSILFTVLGLTIEYFYGK